MAKKQIRTQGVTESRTGVSCIHPLVHVDCKEADHCGCQPNKKDGSVWDSLDWYISCSSHSGSDNDVIGMLARVSKHVLNYDPSQYESSSIVGEVTRRFVHKITGELTYMVFFEGFLGHQAVSAKECRLVGGG